MECEDSETSPGIGSLALAAAIMIFSKFAAIPSRGSEWYSAAEIATSIAAQQVNKKKKQKKKTDFELGLQETINEAHLPIAI